MRQYGKGWKRTRDGRRIHSGSLVEPHLLHAVVAVQRLVWDEVLDEGPGDDVPGAPAEDGTGAVELELSVDLIDKLQPPGRVEHLGLLVDEPVDLLRAVVGVVPGGAALVVLVEVGVGVVDAGARQV